MAWLHRRRAGLLLLAVCGGCAHVLGIGDFDDANGGSGGAGAAVGGSGGAGGAVGGGGAGGGAGAAAGGSTGGGGGGVAPPCVAGTIQPSIARCRSELDPTPTYCAQGGLKLFVDGNGSGNEPVATYLHFDLGFEEDVTSLQLRLQVTDDTGASSVSSGEVWQTLPFDAASVENTAPANIDLAPAAADLGAVTQGMDVEWWLPLDVMVSGGQVYLAVRPTTDNGILYWSNDGTTPPALVVTCR